MTHQETENFILRQKQRIVELKQQNADLLAALNVFFKVVIVDDKQHRPGRSLCAGCDELTLARGWECFYKRETTECKYPDELLKAVAIAKANKEARQPKKAEGGE